MNSLERARIDRGLSIQQLAEEISAHGAVAVNERTVREAEAGLRNTQPAKLKAICDYLGLRPSEVVGELRAARGRRAAA